MVVAGYVRRRTFRLVFADPEMDGLEVRARSASMGKFLEISQLQDAIDATEDPTEDSYERVRTLAGQVAEHIVDWNLEECARADAHDCEEVGCTMQPVPCTAEGLMRQDLEFFRTIVAAWMGAVAGVSGPKEQNSNGGRPSQEALIPMEPLSPSRAS